MPEATTSQIGEQIAAQGTQTASTSTAATNGNATGAFYADWIKPDGSLNADSYKRLPEDIRYFGDKLARYKNPEELVRGFAHLEHMASGKGILPLPANAPADAIAQRKALMDSANGVPKEPKGYGLAKPEKLPEGVEWNDKRAEAFSTWAHKHSVAPQAAKELFDWYLSEIGGDAQSQSAYVNNFFAEQNTQWQKFATTQGIPVDKADALVERGAIALGFNMQDQNHQTLLKNATVRAALMKHALATGEDSSITGSNEGAASSGPETEMQDIMHNEANPLYAPLYDSSHPQHRMAKEKVEQLARQVAAKRK